MVILLLSRTRSFNGINMNLNIGFLNGPRMGGSFSLKEKKQEVACNEFICEDEALLIKIFTTDYYNDLVLCLHENEVPFSSYTEINEGYEYVWRPKKLGQFKHECFFHNYYGLAELSLSYRDSTTGSKFQLCEFEAIEILAKKLTSERVDKMLKFLSDYDTETLAAFFRVTRVRAGYKQGEASVQFLIEQIEKNVNMLATRLPAICSNPISQNTLSTSLIIPNESSSFDENSLAWLSENVDSLFEVDNLDAAILDWEGKLYSSHKVQETIVKKESDTYENQVVYGFVETLINSTNSILHKLSSSSRKTPKTQYYSNDYVSFFSQINSFKNKLNKNKIETCHLLIERLHKIKSTLLAHLNISRSVMGLPRFTYKARDKVNYFVIFQNIAAWYRFGSPDWSTQEELSSIESIPKLFEYYCFFRIKHCLELTGLRAYEDAIFSLNDDDIIYTYDYKGASLKLAYEPKFWVENHIKSGSGEYINSEAWTVYKNKITQRGVHKQYSNRCPDFVIEITKKGKSVIFVLDSKYTYENKAFVNYLPELTMKYIHGITSKTDAMSPTVGLSIIYPSEGEKITSYHQDKYSIFSNTPTIPALMTTSVSPGETGEDSYFYYFIRSILEFLSRALDLKELSSRQTSSKIAQLDFFG